MTQRRLGQLGYVLAILLVLYPAMDLAANVWPWKAGEVGWRYGTYGILSGYFMTPLMGLMLAVGVALALGHARRAKVLASLAWVVGLVFFAATVMYALDALQVRSTVPDQARTQFSIGTIKAVVKNVISAFVLLWIGWVGFRGAKGSASSRNKDMAPPLVSSDR